MISLVLLHSFWSFLSTMRLTMLRSPMLNRRTFKYKAVHPIGSINLLCKFHDNLPVKLEDVLCKVDILALYRIIIETVIPLSTFISLVSCSLLWGPSRMDSVILTEHSRWAPCRSSWWLHTPACVHPSMQSGRCGRSSGQTYTGHSGAVWPGAGNSCGTLECPNCEGK